MKKRIVPILIAVLLIVTAAVAVWHLSTREQYEAGGLTVRFGGTETVLKADSLTKSEIRGETVNGKGETSAIDAQGVALSEVLKAAGADPAAVERIEVIASDEYRAEVTGDELREEGKVCLILQDGGGFQMIVFGDPNSKRNVRDLVAVEVQ